MPQLEPSPWLMTLLLSWLVFITIVPTKVLGHIFPNEPSQQNTQEVKTESWPWSWQ